MVETAERLAHTSSLKIQGQLFKNMEKLSAAIWVEAVLSLPSPHMKFTLNAAQDTLPHNANLARWRGL